MKCEGCADNGQCPLQGFGSVAMDECPCRTCIVKMMCKTTVCKELANHYNSTCMAHNRKPLIKEAKHE